MSESSKYWKAVKAFDALWAEHEAAGYPAEGQEAIRIAYGKKMMAYFEQAKRPATA